MRKRRVPDVAKFFPKKGHGRGPEREEKKQNQITVCWVDIFRTDGLYYCCRTPPSMMEISDLGAIRESLFESAYADFTEKFGHGHFEIGEEEGEEDEEE